MSEKEKRTNRGYKATEKVYRAAMRQAKKDKYALAQIIEQSLRRYGTTGYWPDWMELEEAMRFHNSK